MFPKKLITRRRSLLFGLGMAMAACSSSWGDRAAPNLRRDREKTVRAFDKSTTDLIAMGETSLQERAAAKGLIYGAAAKGCRTQKYSVCS